MRKRIALLLCIIAFTWMGFHAVQAEDSICGSTDASTTFYVYVNVDDALAAYRTITLRMYEGVAYDDYAHLFTERTYGMFNVYVDSEYDGVQGYWLLPVDKWVPSATDYTWHPTACFDRDFCIPVYLGWNKITIVPNDDLFKTYWIIDDIHGWKTASTWELVSKDSDCEVYWNRASRKTEAEILVRDHVYHRVVTRTVTASQDIYIEPVYYDDDWLCFTQGIDVRVRNSVAEPSVIDFYYDYFEEETREEPKRKSADLAVYYWYGQYETATTIHLTGDQYIMPKEISGYTCSERYWVTVHDGWCEPAEIHFHYQPIQADNSKNEDGKKSHENGYVAPNPSNVRWNEKLICLIDGYDVYGSARVGYGYGSGGGRIPVYTGPGEYYYRSASGRAYINAGEKVNIYGMDSGWYLIEYSTSTAGVNRFGYVRKSQISGFVDEYGFMNCGYDALEEDWNVFDLTIQIHANAQHVADQPNMNRSGYDSIDVDYDHCSPLAFVLDSQQNTWIYFESTGVSYCEEDYGEYKPVRGFVPAQYVSIK